MGRGRSGERRRRVKPRRRPPVVLVFGEDDNDREAIKQLLHALRDDLPRVEKRRRPLVLVKGREAAKARKNAEDIAAQVRVDSVRFDVRHVFAHEDCDAVEPAHEKLAKQIERHLGQAGVEATAVTPAWEMETWWFLWPDAVLAVNSRWRRPSRRGQQVGLIENAKEVLRRALRPQGRRTRDYEESDGPKVAAKVRELELVNQLDAVSNSYEQFAGKVERLTL